MLALPLLAILAQAPAPALDFTEEAKILYRVVACGNDAALPEGMDAKIVEDHCKELHRRADLYRATWIKEASPFIQSLKPAGLPTTVVYPFGGGDLISALTTYPEAKEITTMSLEHAGDPRRIKGITAKQLKASLALIRSTSSGLLTANDSKTANLMKGQRGEVPGQLAFFLIALAVHGYEPISLKYLKTNADGSIRYLAQTELDELQKKEAKLLNRVWVAPDFSEAFDNLELIAVKKGGDPVKDRIVHRHFAQNLDDDHFGKDEGMKNYLKARSPIVAMTKAASYLLWRDAFSTIRNYLLENMQFMVSDSTGIPPKFATKAGFSQETYGKFAESFLGASPDYNADFVKLWKDAKPLAFRYGYLDKNLSKHMLITKKAAAK
ncbi:MAG: hypothetical protein Q8N23_10775 [Archangium sp.]|nr:hypothetical protein [Archangium sp.]MDP3572052.1 hypothetical protein [Archangium sp.]